MSKFENSNLFLFHFVTSSRCYKTMDIKIIKRGFSIRRYGIVSDPSSNFITLNVLSLGAPTKTITCCKLFLKSLKGKIRVTDNVQKYALYV